MSNYYGSDDDPAQAFFRRAAKTEGLSYHDWCKKYGIVDGAALERVHRHEISREAWQDGNVSQFVDAEGWTSAYKRRVPDVTNVEVCELPGSAAIDPVTDNDAA